MISAVAYLKEKTRTLLRCFSRQAGIVSGILLIVVFCGISVRAADESYVQTLSGKIKKGDSCVVIDDKFNHLSLADWNQIHNLRVDNIISFELRQDSSFYFHNRAFSCTPNVTIKYFTSRDQQDPTEIKDVKLVVKYDTASGSYNPSVGYETQNGVIISPASVFNHEVNHAAGNAADPLKQQQRANTDDKQYGDKEERRVITTSE